MEVEFQNVEQEHHYVLPPCSEIVGAMYVRVSPHMYVEICRTSVQTQATLWYR